MARAVAALFGYGAACIDFDMNAFERCEQVHPSRKK